LHHGRQATSAVSHQPELGKCGHVPARIESLARTSKEGAAVYSSIVVGTDGSETAAKAVAVAADLARRCGATLHLVQAYQQSAGAMAVPIAGVAASDSGMGNALLAQEAEDTLAETAQTLDGVTIEQHAGRGAPADVIVSLAEQLQADLIVVGSKGMHRRILGSVPNSVAHSAGCAVLIVKTT